MWDCLVYIQRYNHHLQNHLGRRQTRLRETRDTRNLIRTSRQLDMNLRPPWPTFIEDVRIQDGVLPMCFTS